MEVTQLPYNKFLGLETDGDGRLALPDDPRYANHLGTVHAGALFSLAEAGSGQFLLSSVDLDPNAVVAVLRSGEIKYKRPGRGRIWSRCKCAPGELEALQQSLASRGRATVAVQVELVDAEDNVVVLSEFRWLVSRR